MRRVLFAVAAVAAMSAAPAAFADCVDFDPARAARAAAALTRNPPAPVTLGMPTLDGLVLDASRTAGDPVCDGPTPKRFYYTTSLTPLAFYSALHPNIRRRTETDGMNRTWFRNPLSGDRLFLTSGTEVTVQTSGDGAITLLKIVPATPVAPLTAESQPYTASEIADWTPWPGGRSGPREFLRADGGAGAPAAAASPVQQAGQQTAQQTQTPAQPNCPAQPGSAEGSQAGAQIGGAVGGSYGRAAGAMLGGLMGSRRSAPAQSQPNCR